MVDNMKKTIFLFIFALFGTLASLSANADYLPELIKGMPLLKYNGYAYITPHNIKSVKIVRYTEGGVSEKDITNKAEIHAIYNSLHPILYKLLI